MAGVLSTTRTLYCASSQSHSCKVTKHGAISQGVIPVVMRFKSNIGEEYQYIARSKVPTLHFQKSLPRLPIPDLAKTCERYLRAQQPLLSTSNFNQTKVFVEDFLRNDGVKCQNALKMEDSQNKHTSYISKPWFDMYLSDRRPLPINYNPFLVFVDNPKQIYNTQLVKATNLVISSLRFFRSLNEGVLEPEIFHLKPAWSKTPFFKAFTGVLPPSISWYGAYLFKAYPLDMSQYSNLFNTTRVPKIGKDYIKHSPGKKHILVMKGGNFYVFDVFDKNGAIFGPELILNSIQEILLNKDPVAMHPVGILTTEDRDVWAAARKHLEEIGNSEVLDLIDSSIFNLVLDECIDPINPVTLTRLFLHADGKNRWFDKSFSLMVNCDGTAGVNFEHSWGDGVAVLRYFNEIHEDSTKNPHASLDHRNSKVSTSVRKLEFKLDDKIKSTIAEARKKYEQTCESLEIRIMEYTEMGRLAFKTLDISPDAMMQLAFQMSYDKMYDKQVATYESCSTCAFKHGRTETVRPCTIETQKFCKSIKGQTTKNKEQLQQMLIQCSKIHSTLIKEAAMGQGFDRHMFALRLKSEALGLKPNIFSDPAYQAINHNILSTSTLSSDNIQLGAFGPVVHNGFGIAYSIWNNRLGTILTSYKNQSDGAGFIDGLTSSFDILRNILAA